MGPAAGRQNDPSRPPYLCGSHSGPVVLKWELVYEGSCASWWLWGLVAPGLGRLKPDTTDRVTGAARPLTFQLFPSLPRVRMREQGVM